MPPAIRQHQPTAMRRHAMPKRDNPLRTIPLRTAAWQKLRAYVLSREPFCRACVTHPTGGRLVAATDVDHSDDNPANNDLGNLVPLCHSCHSRRTRLWMNQREKSPATEAARPRPQPRARDREIGDRSETCGISQFFGPPPRRRA
jgi:5-methylcytosine-specific restriction endonuclease McrA